jgi:ubiquinone/menaquinone biosynthesis C-methylase UbiE
MSGLEFTDEAAWQLEALYLTADVVAQRSATLDRLDLAKGETVIDIGCGPGFLCESMAEIVGTSGRIVGIDISSDLLALATRRNSRSWLSYRVGDATSISEPDARFDVAVCTQVAEYVPKVDKVISEAFRVLKPNGRAVFVATDWDALVWHSDDPDRMAAVMKSWAAHCAHPRLPRSLAKRLQAAGFVLKEASVFPILNTEWGDDTYSKGLSRLIRDFVAGRGDVPADDLTAWLEELSQISDEGRYFFSTNRFIFKVLKAR